MTDKMDEIRLQRDDKKLIINHVDRMTNIIILSREDSTDKRGQYISLNMDDLKKINEYVSGVVNQTNIGL